MDTNDISLHEIHAHITQMQQRENSPTVQSLSQVFFTFYNNTNDKQNHSIW